MAVIDSPGPGRVLIALTDGPLVAEPTWTRFDNITACRNYGYDCYAGRQSELDTTDTGNASIYFHDQNKSLTGTDLIGCQVMLQLYNPVLAEWEIRWRGHIDDVGRNLVDVPLAPLADTTISAVGIFDYLGGVKMQPGGAANPFGHGGGPVDVAFYEDAPVDERIITLLTDAMIASTMRVVFSGNVWVCETMYDPDDVILQACRDATDAEWPGVANFYEDRFGRCVFHGRFARFDPEATAVEGNWEFTRWDASTREDVTAGFAQIRDFSWNVPRARIINSYLAYPKTDENGVLFDRELIPTLQKVDTASKNAYGWRGDEAPDLIVLHHKTNGNTSADECEIYGQWYVTNYSQPRMAVQSISFNSTRPDDARAAATWDLMCRADVSDVIELTIDEADLAAEEFFIDGIGIECRPLNPSYDLVTMTPNLTPGSYYGNPEEA